MASHNTRPGTVFHKTPPANRNREETNEFLRLTLSEDALCVDDDSGYGGDPYNSAGQQMTRKPRRKTD